VLVLPEDPFVLKGALSGPARRGGTRAAWCPLSEPLFDFDFNIMLDPGEGTGTGLIGQIFPYDGGREWRLDIMWSSLPFFHCRVSVVCKCRSVYGRSNTGFEDKETRDQVPSTVPCF